MPGKGSSIITSGRVRQPHDTTRHAVCINENGDKDGDEGGACDASNVRSRPATQEMAA